MRRLAVVFAIDRYPRFVATPLRGPVGDARAFERFLKSPNGGSFADHEVIVRIDRDATSRAFRDAVDEAAARGVEQLIVFLNGHGGELGFVFADGEVGYDAIGSTLKVTGASRKLVIIDACLSGLAHGRIAGFGGLEKVASDISHAYIDLLAASCPGARVLSATNRTGLAPSRLSFTRHLLAVARTAAPDLGLRGVSADRVFRQTRAMFRRTLGVRFPHPQASGGLDDFPIAMSDHLIPFGATEVSAGRPWAWFTGGVVHEPLMISVTGRRSLPTTIRVVRETSLGRVLVHEEVVTPTRSIFLRNLEPRRAPFVGYSRLVVDVLDEQGRQVGHRYVAHDSFPRSGWAATG